MAMTLNSEDIAAILAAIEGSTVLALVTSLSPLALEASLAVLALDATVAKEASLAALAQDATVAKTSDIPLPADIADAVFDEDMTAHNVAGSAGEALMVTADAAPTASDVAAAVLAAIVTGSVTVEDVLSLLYGAQASGGSGGGALPYTVTVTEDGAPSDGAEVWISTDEAGTNVIAGTLVTNALGHAVFMLDAATYYLWKQKSGVNFTNPETIVVS